MKRASITVDESSRIVVAIVARNPKLRERIAGVLEGQDVDVAAQGADAPELAARNAGVLDVVVLASGLSTVAIGFVRGLIRRLDAPRIVVVAPSSSTDQEVRAALRAHVDAVVLASKLESALVPTVRAVHAEQVVFPRRDRRRSAVPALSHREKQVLRLAAAGYTNDEIAGNLYLATSTVKGHLTSAFGKLAVRSRSEAAAILHDPDEPIAQAVLAVDANHGFVLR